jgi:hypothetical protein
LTERRTVTIRFAEGDAAGVTAVVRVYRGGRSCAELALHARKPAATFAYELDPDADGSAGRALGTGYAYEVEYQWGYAREAWHKGESDTDELILPFPGSTGKASFPFRGR